MARLILALFALSACRNGPLEDTDKGVDGDTGGLSVDADADGFSADEDCDDADAEINPGATELCDGADNDCDGDTDEDVTNTYYADVDGDSYGDALAPTEDCQVPEGHVEAGGDCDDADATVYPSARELCDGLDNDCDGEIDEEDAYPWYADGDGDGYGDPDQEVIDCAEPSGYVDNGDDCDDTSPDAAPDVEEVCDDMDNDCDGEVDEGVTTAYYEDRDSDAYGDSDAVQKGCALPEGYAELGGDCDDSAAAVNPGAAEICNEVDDDCDGAVDEDEAIDASSWYLDADSDGFGDASSGDTACTAPSGYVSDATDCDDSTAAVNPDATEVCNEVDDDCDGSIDDADASLDSATGSTWYADADSDSYGDAGTSSRACDQPAGSVADSSDCDDGDDAIHPAATEICNEVDDDCDGDVDDADSDLDSSTGATWYADSDSDGYGDASRSSAACDQPSGYVSDNDDCDDSSSDVNPGRDEICNEMDDDCDGDIDDADSDLDKSSATTWYEDSDSDGFGDASASKTTCDRPSGYVTDNDDCDDGDGAIHPDATEVCDGADNDCDGDSDDDDSDLDSSTASTWYADADSDGYGDAD